LKAETVDIQGGSLVGPGTITGNVHNAGEVDVAADGIIGELAISGTYTQTAAGVLKLKVNGPGTAGVDYDWLNAAGDVTLDGTVNVIFLYVPAINDSFTPLTGNTVTGRFATVNSNLDPSMQLNPTYDPADVTFTVGSSG
jgi:hypothetical protein